MMWRRFFYRLGTTAIATIAIAGSVLPASAKPWQEIQEMARKFTVQIRPSGDYGSGVLIGREGNTYYALTAWHVVSSINPDESGRIVPYDQITQTGIQFHCRDIVVKPVAECGSNEEAAIDLAVVKFTSDKDYPVATLSQYQYNMYRNVTYSENGSMQTDRSNGELPSVYIGGYPLEGGRPEFRFNPGRLFDNTGTALSHPRVGIQGYRLVYTNLSHRGISGGPVLDAEGRLIGIHGRGDGKEIRRETDDEGNIVHKTVEDFIEEVSNKFPVKLGLSAGIPMPTVLQWIQQHSSDQSLLSLLDIENSAPSEATSNASLKNSWQPPQITQNPGNPFRFIALGNNKWRLNNIKEALSDFEKAIALQPEYFLGYLAKGIALSYAQRYEESLQACATARRKIEATLGERRENSRYRYDPLRCEAEAYAKLGKTATALERLNEAINLDFEEGRNPSDLALKAEWLYAQQQYRGSEQAFTEAIELREESELPRSPLLFNNRATVRMQLSKKQAAFQDIETALDINPNFAPAWSNKGWWLRLQGQLAKSLEAYNRAVKLAPNDANAWNNRGMTLYQMGRESEALESFEEALEIDPNYTPAQENRDALVSQQ
jgi:tetratricopeptide (TPR) repeat protein